MVSPRPLKRTAHGCGSVRRRASSPCSTKTLVGTAVAGGPDRANKAADMAVACPQLEGIDLSGARGVLVLVAATNRKHAVAKVDALASKGVDEIEIPAFLRKQAD